MQLSERLWHGGCLRWSKAVGSTPLDVSTWGTSPESFPETFVRSVVGRGGGKNGCRPTKPNPECPITPFCVFFSTPVSNTNIHLPELPISNIFLSSLSCFYYFISELHAWIYCILILSDPSNTFQNLPTTYTPSLFFLIIPWVYLVLPWCGWVEGYPWSRATWERSKENWLSLLWQPSTTRDSQLEVGPCESPLPKLVF